MDFLVLIPSYMDAHRNRGNYVREMPGWKVETVHDGLGDQPHTVRTTTPTGHTYTSRAGPAP